MIKKFIWAGVIVLILIISIVVVIIWGIKSLVTSDSVTNFITDTKSTITDTASNVMPAIQEGVDAHIPNVDVTDINAVVGTVKDEGTQLIQSGKDELQNLQNLQNLINL